MVRFDVFSDYLPPPSFAFQSFLHRAEKKDKNANSQPVKIRFFLSWYIQKAYTARKLEEKHTYTVHTYTHSHKLTETNNKHVHAAFCQNGGHNKESKFAKSMNAMRGHQTRNQTKPNQQQQQQQRRQTLLSDFFYVLLCCAGVNTHTDMHTHRHTEQWSSKTTHIQRDREV